MLLPYWSWGMGRGSARPGHAHAADIQRCSVTDEVNRMPFPSTPRLCAHCGAELGPADSIMMIEDVRSGEQRLLHQSCFTAGYELVDAESAHDTDGDPSRCQHPD